MHKPDQDVPVKHFRPDMYTNHILKYSCPLLVEHSLKPSQIIASWENTSGINQ